MTQNCTNTYSLIGNLDKGRLTGLVTWAADDLQAEDAPEGAAAAV
jgi:hypothetical protein